MNTDRFPRWSPVHFIAILGGVVAVLSRWILFPDGSFNSDEVGYLSQADAVAHRKLTLPASSYDPYFRPFLSGTYDGRVVFKYQPLWPALIALGNRLTGTPTTALAMSGACFAAAAYWFGFEASNGKRRVATVTSVIAVCSPFAVLQAGTYLSYMPSAALLCVASACLLRGLRLDQSKWLGVSGLFFGLAFFHRSFDAALWLFPSAVFGVTRLRGSEQRWRATRWFVAGLAPGVAMFLAYNFVVMGSIARPAFEASGDLDKFGFGRRASFVVEGEPGGIKFTPGMSFGAAWQCIIVLWRLTLGAWLAIPLAIYGVKRLARRMRAYLLALVFVSPVGYLAWWGVANSVEYNLHRSLGPMYWFASVVPIATLCATAVDGLLDRSAAQGRVPLARTAGIICIALVAASTVGAWPVMKEASGSGQQRSARVESMRALNIYDGQTLLLAMPELPGDPYDRTVIPADLQSEKHSVALGVDTGVGRIDLLRRIPERDAWEERDEQPYDGIFESSPLVLTHLNLLQGRTIHLKLTTLGSESVFDISGLVGG